MVKLAHIAGYKDNVFKHTSTQGRGVEFLGGWLPEYYIADRELPKEMIVSGDRANTHAQEIATRWHVNEDGSFDKRALAEMRGLLSRILTVSKSGYQVHHRLAGSDKRLVQTAEFFDLEAERFFKLWGGENLSQKDYNRTRAIIKGASLFEDGSFSERRLQAIMTIGFGRNLPKPFEDLVRRASKDYDGDLYLAYNIMGFDCEGVTPNRFNFETGKRGIDLHNESKSLLLEARDKSTNEVVLLHLMMPGDYFLHGVGYKIQEPPILELLAKSGYSMDLLTKQFNPNVASGLNLEKGSINIVSVIQAAEQSKRYSKVVHLVDEALLEVKGLIYTNASWPTRTKAVADIEKFTQQISSSSERSEIIVGEFATNNRNLGTDHYRGEKSATISL